MKQLSGLPFSAYAAGVSFCIIDTLAVVARLWIRRQDRFGLDDLFLLCGWVSTMVFIGMAIAAILEGDGVYQPSDPGFSYQKSRQFLKIAYFDRPFNFFGISFIRLSIIMLYRRIFCTKSFRRFADVTAILCFVWMLAAVFIDFFWCVPAAHVWDPTVKGHCFNLTKFFLAGSIIELMFDFVVLVMPFPVISQLQLSLQKKVGLCGVFALGILVLITAIVRIVVIYHPNRNLISFVGGQLWSMIQLSTALLCACALTYKPMLRSFVQGFSVVKDYYSRVTSTVSSPRSSWTNTPQGSISTKRSHDYMPGARKYPTSTVQFAGNGSDVEKTSMASSVPDVISVRNEWSVEHGVERV